MRVISVNVGLPREVSSGGKPVLTAIFKSPVEGRLQVVRHNLAGDRQANLAVHGGRAKAVYAYPSEHYAFWREQLPSMELDMDLRWGSFGENLTTEGIVEDDVHLGDRLRIGTAEFLVTQPRMPCFKLGIRFDRPEMVKRFLESRRSGFYLEVASEGELGADDRVEILQRHAAAVSIPELLKMYVREQQDPERLRAAIAVPALSDSWRQDLRERLETVSG